jgi:ubiquinone biosynthesis protein UbiJ
MELRVDGFAPIRLAVFAGRLAVTTGPGAVAGAGTAAVGADAGASGDPDAVIAGPPLALLDLFARREDRSVPRRSERVLVTGDAEVAARYRELLELARPDWEEELSRLVGDLPARRVSLAARAALAWARGFARTAQANVSEYLQEESRVLVSRPEVLEFLGQVDVLRETADRVEARIARLERRIEGRRELEGPA